MPKPTASRMETRSLQNPPSPVLLQTPPLVCPYHQVPRNRRFECLVPCGRWLVSFVWLLRRRDKIFPCLLLRFYLNETFRAQTHDGDETGYQVAGKVEG